MISSVTAMRISEPRSSTSSSIGSSFLEFAGSSNDPSLALALALRLTLDLALFQMLHMKPGIGVSKNQDLVDPKSGSDRRMFLAVRRARLVHELNATRKLMRLPANWIERLAVDIET